MNKFKVGDRVTLTGVVTGMDEYASKDNQYGPYLVLIDGEKMTDLFSEEALSARTDTTFRDQAAIAALYGLISNLEARSSGIPKYIANDAFQFAEALDAERKKRDGE